MDDLHKVMTAAVMQFGKADRKYCFWFGGSSPIIAVKRAIPGDWETFAQVWLSNGEVRINILRK